MKRWEKVASLGLTVVVCYIAVPIFMGYIALRQYIKGFGVSPRKATDAVNVGSFD